MARQSSVGSDEQEADAGDDDGGREAELEVAQEGERVAVVLGAARLLAHDEVGGGAQQGEVAGHRAGPGQDEPRVGLGGRGDGGGGGGNPGAQQENCQHHHLVFIMIIREFRHANAMV